MYYNILYIYTLYIYIWHAHTHKHTHISLSLYIYVYMVYNTLCKYIILLHICNLICNYIYICIYVCIYFYIHIRVQKGQLSFIFDYFDGWDVDFQRGGHSMNGPVHKKPGISEIAFISGSCIQGILWNCNPGGAAWHFIECNLQDYNLLTLA